MLYMYVGKKNPHLPVQLDVGHWETVDPARLHVRRSSTLHVYDSTLLLLQLIEVLLLGVHYLLTLRFIVFYLQKGRLAATHLVI